MAVQQLVTVASVSVDRNSRASAKSAWMISGLKEKNKIKCGRVRVPVHVRTRTCTKYNKK